MSPSTSETSSLQVPLFLWGAIFSSTFMMLGALFVVRPEGMTPDPMMLPVLGAVALGTACFTLIFPKRLFRAALQGLNVDTTEIEDPTSLPGSGRMLKVPKHPEVALRAVFQRHQTPFILGLALGESVSLFGFVLGYLGFPLPFVLPFFVASWGLMAVQFPNRAAILREAQQVTGVHFEPPSVASTSVALR